MIRNELIEWGRDERERIAHEERIAELRQQTQELLDLITCFDRRLDRASWWYDPLMYLYLTQAHGEGGVLKQEIQSSSTTGPHSLYVKRRRVCCSVPDLSTASGTALPARLEDVVSFWLPALPGCGGKTP